MSLTAFKYFALFIFTVILLTGCNGSGDGENKPETVSDKQNEKSAANTTSSEEPGEITLTDAAKLKDVLPQKINGCKAYPASTGSSELYASAAIDFDTGEQGYLHIAVHDYGLLENIPEKPDYSSLTKLPNAETTEINYLGQRGYKIWNAEKRFGKLYMIVNDRFTVQVEAEKIPEEAGSLMDILRKIEIKKLSK